jgi:DNA-binding MarR family transcriptional regulator
VKPLALDPVIHQATRLRILAALYKNRESSFTDLRNGLDLTDGNLASHAERLQEAGYLDARRALAGLSFEVRYRITAAGSEAFRAYVAELRSLLADAVEADSGTAQPLSATLPERPTLE